MIDETIARLEARLRESQALRPENRQELLRLIGQLKGELSTLERTHAENARNIGGHTERLTEAATSEPDPDLFQRSLKELSDSVGGFETSHPKLVQVVNRIATTLSNLGI